LYLKQFGLPYNYGGPPGWGLDARLTTLFCKKKILPPNPKTQKPDGKTGGNFYGSLWLN
jgi:hypothetical protein